MNETAMAVLMGLGRTTVVLAGSAVLVFGLLRALRLSTPRVHRAAWCLVLLQGWLWLRLPVAVPYDAPSVAERGAERQAATLRSPALKPSIADGPRSTPASPMAKFSSTAEVAPDRVPSAACPDRVPWAACPPLPERQPGSTRSLPSSCVLPSPGAFKSSTPEGTTGHHRFDDSATGVASHKDVDDSRTSWTATVAGFASRWSVAAWGVAVWALGMACTLTIGLGRYVRFVRRLPVGSPPEEEWVAQWESLLNRQGVRRAIPLCVTESLGPLLCRLPGRFVLLVPGELWIELTPAQRLTILRHELAHFQRADLWKSLAVRLLALPHWFNPAAWWAVRRFDEAAEWACDRAAVADAPELAPRYADALLRLVEPSRPAAFGSAARGGGLAHRIRRLLALHSMEDSIMKRLCVLGVALALIAAGSVQVVLVAKERPRTAAKSTAPPTPARDLPIDVPIPKSDKRSSKPAEPSRLDALQAERVKVLREAVSVAEIRYRDGKATFDAVCEARENLCQAELAASRTSADRIAVHHRRVANLREMEAIAKTLHEAGGVGGEYEKVLSATTRRIDAEIALEEERAKAGRRVASAPSMPIAPPDNSYSSQVQPATPSDKAKTSFNRLVAAQRQEEAVLKAYEEGRVTMNVLLDAMRRRCEYEADAAASPAEEVKVLKASLAHHEKVWRALRPRPTDGGSRSPRNLGEEEEEETGREAGMQAQINLLKAAIKQREAAMNALRYDGGSFGQRHRVTQPDLKPERGLDAPASAASSESSPAERQKKFNRMRAAQRSEEAVLKAYYVDNTITMSVLLDQMRRRCEAEIEASGSPAEQVRVFQMSVARHRELEEKIAGRIRFDAQPDPKPALAGPRRDFQADLAQLREQRVLLENHLATRQAELAKTLAELRYDGGNFEQWRKTARTELKPERRLEAIRAFGAFASKGYGPEPVKAIIEVMRDYDLRNTRSKSIEEMTKVALWMFSDDMPTHVAADLAVPLLREELVQGPRNGRHFAARALSFVGSAAKPALPDLAEAVDKDEAPVRHEACLTLIKLDTDGHHLDVVGRFVERNPALAEEIFSELARRSFDDGQAGRGEATDTDSPTGAKRAIPARAEVAVAILAAAIRDKNRSVRLAAVNPLSNAMFVPSAKTALIQAASHDDADTRFAVVSQLARCRMVKNDELVPLLVNAIDREARPEKREKLFDHLDTLARRPDLATLQSFAKSLLTIKRWTIEVEIEIEPGIRDRNAIPNRADRLLRNLLLYFELFAEGSSPGVSQRGDIRELYDRLDRAAAELGKRKAKEKENASPVPTAVPASPTR